jgi:formylglycine-generating enzyme required for sulfatase activity
VNCFEDDFVANGYDDGFAVTGLPADSFDFSQNYLTDVGAYTFSAGPYGTFDQGGNVYEWNETFSIRGGAWWSPSFELLASYDFADVESTREDEFIGFRVAGIPEPATTLLGALATLGLLLWRRR